MWVNIFWLLMPFYTINYYLISNLKGQAIKIVEEIVKEVESEAESEFEV